jgi:AcrR family transcriptional regulator
MLLSMSDTSHALRLLVGPHPPRADAERNVSALLTATRGFVAAGELNPSAAQIAEAAGVGVGTLYRRALGKEALLAAVVIELLDEVCERAKDQAGESWAEFERFAIDYIRIREVTCSITHALDRELDGGLADAKRRTRAAFESLTRRLQDAQVLDAIIEPADLMVVLASIDLTVDTLGLEPDEARRQRVVRRLLSSLRRQV